MTEVGRSLTIFVDVSWGVPEGLVEFGKVENHQQLVRLGHRSHLLPPRHRLNAKLPLCQVKRQLVVRRHVVLVQRVIVAEEEPEQMEVSSRGTSSLFPVQKEMLHLILKIYFFHQFTTGLM